VATIDDDAAIQPLLDTLERWLASDVVPNVLELEHADEYPRLMVEQMREFGLFAATIPDE
jgi:alkylation response protein AidB-like acyl-CoA dehydrogenase